jgi:preprotein translocase subunit SecE
MAKTIENAKAQVEKSVVKGGKGKKKFNPMVFFRRIGKFFREVVSELKKVAWPSRKELTSYTVAALVFIAICGVITFVMDTGLQAAVNVLLR